MCQIGFLGEQNSLGYLSAEDVILGTTRQDFYLSNQSFKGGDS